MISAASISRPVIYDGGSISDYVSRMIEWLKHSDSNFSIRQETARLKDVSPALVTQLAHGKRSLTRDRVSSIAQLLRLTKSETQFLDSWVAGERTPQIAIQEIVTKKRADPQNHLLNDWLNVYVKDACGLKGFKPNANVIYHLLGGIATVARIEKSLLYLQREGFLRRNTKGQLVKNDSLTTTTENIPSTAIKRFHKKALDLAQRGIDDYPPERRRAAAVVVSLNESSYQKLFQLVGEFHEQLKKFVEDHPNDDERLYQVLLHLSPIGGKTGTEKNRKHL
jgi:uncharacterized protein (TIGR02147 family)